MKLWINSFFRCNRHAYISRALWSIEHSIPIFRTNEWNYIYDEEFARFQHLYVNSSKYPNPYAFSLGIIPNTWKVSNTPRKAPSRWVAFIKLALLRAWMTKNPPNVANKLIKRAICYKNIEIGSPYCKQSFEWPIKHGF